MGLKERKEELGMERVDVSRVVLVYRSANGKHCSRGMDRYEPSQTLVNDENTYTLHHITVDGSPIEVPLSSVLIVRWSDKGADYRDYVSLETPCTVSNRRMISEKVLVKEAEMERVRDSLTGSSGIVVGAMRRALGFIHSDGLLS